MQPNPAFWFDPNTHKKLWQLAWPMMLSNLTVPLLGLVDTAVIGHLDYPWYLGGLAVASSIFMFLYFSFNFLRMGTTGFAAQSYGQKDYLALKLLLTRASCLALALGVMLSLLSPWLLPVATRLIGGSPEVQEAALQYSQIRILSAPFALLNFVIIGWLIGVHRTQGPLIILTATNLINVVLDILLVVIWPLGIQGVAIATIVADISGSLLGLYLVLKQLQQWSAPKLILLQIINWPAIRSLLSVNGDIFFRSLALLSAFAFFTAQGAKISDQVLAANAVLISFLLIIASALDGFANAAEAMAGQALGQTNRTQLQEAVAVSGLWTAIFALFLSGIFYFFGDAIISLLTDIETVRLTANHYLVWIIVLPLLACWCFWLDGVFIGITQTRTMRNTMLIALIFIFYPLWFFSQGWGNNGLWLAMNGFMLSRGILLGGCYLKWSKGF